MKASLPPSSGTLLDALDSAAGSGNGLVFVGRDGDVRLSFARLRADAGRIASALAARGVEGGDRVVLSLSTGPEFARHYFALVHLGAVPCVQPSPRAHATPEVGLARLQEVCDRLRARLVITEPAENARWGGSLRRVAVLDAVEDLHAWPTAPGAAREPSDTALIQATSGSTAGPKCIALSHANVVANCAQIDARIGGRDGDVSVGWLPMFHDLGLIGTFLYPLCRGRGAVLMSPARFMRRPAVWLEAISTHRGSCSPAPNFGFRHVVERVTEAELVGLDLSCWKAAICGGERIDPDALRGFAARLASTGFDRRALMPAYGLAEATLCVTMDSPRGDFAVEGRECEPDARRDADGAGTAGPATVGCGPPVPPTRVDVVDEAGEPVAAGVPGRIRVCGPSVMQGYLGEDGSVVAEPTGEPLDTGDVGYLRDGQLFVVGRAKEVIIIRGQNRFPTEFEAAAAELAACARMRFMAIGVPCPAAGEALHLIGEHAVAVPMDRADDDERLAETVARHVAARTGVLPARVSFVPRRTLPLTTSGKLRRRAFREAYLETCLEGARA